VRDDQVSLLGRRLTRRDMLRLLGLGTAALGLAACSQAPATPAAAPTSGGAAAAPTQPPAAAAPTTVAPTRAAAPTTAAAAPTAAATTAPAAAATRPVAQATPAVSGGGPKITLNYWDFQQSDKSILDAFEKARQDFQKANPNIEVKVTVTPYPQYRDALLKAAQGGNAPDVATVDQGGWTTEFAASGTILPLDDLVGKSSVIKKDVYFPGAWDSNFYQGKMWGVPMNNDVWEENYYNADLLNSAGVKPPTTWDELTDALKKLNKPPDQFGVGLLGHKGEDTIVTILSFIMSNGGAVLSDDGKTVMINQPPAVEALDFYQSLAQYAPEGTLNRAEPDAANLFTAGKIAMTWDGSWQQDTYNNRAPNMKWDLAMMPAPKGKSFVGCLGGWNLVIFKQSKNQDAAFKWIEFLSDKQVQQDVNSLIPARSDAGEAFVRAKRKQPDVILKTVQTGKAPRSNSPVWPQISDALQTMMQDLLSGTKAKDAADKAASAIDKIVKSV